MVEILCRSCMVLTSNTLSISYHLLCYQLNRGYDILMHVYTKTILLSLLALMW